MILTVCGRLEGDRPVWSSDVKTTETLSHPSASLKHCAEQKPCAQVKQNKEFIHCFPWLGRCSAIPGEQGPITGDADLGRQIPPVQTSSPCSFFPPTLYNDSDVTWSGISPRSAGVTCPGQPYVHKKQPSSHVAYSQEIVPLQDEMYQRDRVKHAEM